MKDKEQALAYILEKMVCTNFEAHQLQCQAAWGTPLCSPSVRKVRYCPNFAERNSNVWNDIGTFLGLILYVHKHKTGNNNLQFG